MSINSNYTYLARAMNNISNPNGQTGTLLLEVPVDFARAHEGYKRGGIIEGTEKFRKEVFAALVWLFGIPVFNKLGNVFCEKILSIPMDIDYSNAKDGIDSIKNSVDYLTTGIKNNNGLDVSDLKKYGTKYLNQNKDTLIKKIKGAKQITSIAALILNCVLMGIVLPKANQAITRRKLNKNKPKETLLQTTSLDDFQKNTKKDNNVTFKGNIADFITYGINNSNKFRLLSTDVPTVAGRIATSRNKYEALEVGFVDAVSIFFYNFSKDIIHNGLNKFGNVPNINPKLAEYLSGLKSDTLIQALEQAKENKPIRELFNNDEQITKEIYQIGTYGKYGKINRFVKNSELEDIDKIVRKFLTSLKDKNVIENGALNKDKIKKIVGSINRKNALHAGIGIALSSLSLGVILPKIAYAITRKITGKNEFIGISDIDDKKKK